MTPNHPRYSPYPPSSSSGHPTIITHTINSRQVEDQCSICLSALDTKALECGHEFHLVCILGWQNESDNCPNCSRPFTITNWKQIKWHEVEQQTTLVHLIHRLRTFRIQHLLHPPRPRSHCQTILSPANEQHQTGPRSVFLDTGHHRQWHPLSLLQGHDWRRYSMDYGHSFGTFHLKNNGIIIGITGEYLWKKQIEAFFSRYNTFFFSTVILCSPSIYVIHFTSKNLFCFSNEFRVFNSLTGFGNFVLPLPSCPKIEFT